MPGFGYAYVRVRAPRSQIASIMDARVHELFATLADFDAARTIHRGPYERLFEAWREVAAWAEDQGLAPVDHLWERYLDGPTAAVDPDKYRTELLRPLEASALF